MNGGVLNEQANEERKKGTAIFSESYQQIVAEKPHIKYTTSAVIWGIVVLLLAVIIAEIFLISI